MRISKVIAQDVETKEKQIFAFGTASDGKDVVTSKGGKLNSYLEFCFREDASNQKDVEVVFNLDGEEYSLTKKHAEDGTTRSMLKKKVDGRWQVIARNKNAVVQVEDILKDEIAELIKRGYVNNIAVDNFHGDLSVFDSLKMLSEVKDEILASSAKTRVLKDKAFARAQQFALSGIGGEVSTERIDAVNEQIDNLSRDIAIATAELGDLKAQQSVSQIRDDIAAKLEAAQQRYKILSDHQSVIEEARAKIVLRDQLVTFIPKVKALQNLAKQRAEYEKKRYAVTTELEWQENELAYVNQQLEEKQRQYVVMQDKRYRIKAINDELAYIAQLYEDNKRLNEILLDLNEKKQQLTSERVAYLNKLNSVEKSLGDVKSNLDEFQIPAKSVSELLETVRVDVKIDEINTQLDKLQSEIAVKESLIAEKQSALVALVKRFRSVAELDVAISPIKAKDTILQVLDAKYSKLEAINISLDEKQRNLERAMEDYKYRIVQLENSRAKLEGERAKALMRKQEEFKREVLVNSQKVYTEDASAIFAASVNFQDSEIEAFEQEIAQRMAERDQLVQRAAELEGSIKEIKRHIEINSAEMETLRGEKNNINNRYNEIVSQNSSETVFNYLKALNSDNGTKYLLDVQQEAVRAEAELQDLKRYTESLRTKVSALKSRLNYLQKTQIQLDDSQLTVDNLIYTNDRIKENLSDIGDRLSAGHEQYTSICRQLESINSKLDDIDAAIVETSKTIKVNEKQIAQSTQKAQRIAGSNDLEKALENLRYDLGDVESERQMLVETKQGVERDVFKKRLELEKAQWLYESKGREYEEMYRELQLEFNLKGLDADRVTSMDFEDDMDALRKEIAEYDTLKVSLADKIENYYNLLKDDDATYVSNEVIEKKQKALETMFARQAELERKRQEQLELYAAQSVARTKVAAAAVEAKTYASLKRTLNHSDIVGLLIADKIKATLSVATQYLNTFTDGNYVLTEEGGKVVVNAGGEKTAYDDLSEQLKTAVYVSMILAVPDTDVTEGRWLIFEERIAMDNKALSEMLRKMDNISYVVEYKTEKVGQPKEQQTTAPKAQKKNDAAAKPVADEQTQVAEPEQTVAEVPTEQQAAEQQPIAAEPKQTKAKSRAKKKPVAEQQEQPTEAAAEPEQQMEQPVAEQEQTTESEQSETNVEEATVAAEPEAQEEQPAEPIEDVTEPKQEAEAVQAEQEVQPEAEQLAEVAATEQVAAEPEQQTEQPEQTEEQSEVKTEEVSEEK